MNHIRLAKNDDEEEILKLYRSLVGTKNCAWTLEYPSVEDIRRDVAMDSLYCLCDETGQIIATASASCDDELTGLNWNENMKNPCELARVGVNPLRHNQGLGQEMVA
ncbi:MAG: GNAT family N-acetyltransferase, partial [Clostridiales bacterium]|nr:GNAT family N-acetyltransferase [Clostridiales bacterium]